MQKVNKLGIELIKKHEGFVPFVYLDCAGYLTIGYGHLCREKDFYLKGKTLDIVKKLYLKDKSKIQKLTKISKYEAEKLLYKDLMTAELGVSKLIKVPLNLNQFSALVSFTFNLGAGALQRSTLRQKLNRGEYLSVPNEMLKWVYAGGIRRKGLLKRRLEESLLFSH
jgi:lysozyme